MKITHFINVILLGCLFISCNKDSDTQHPIIDLTSPTELEEFNVPDTIKVTASITDDNVIKRIVVVLVDNEFNSVLPSIIIYPNKTSYSLEVEYPLDDLYLETGEYYLQVRAEDGPNFKNEYQLIKVFGIPRKLEKVIYLSQSSNNRLEVFEIDQSDHINFLFDEIGDYTASDIDSRYQQVYIAGRNSINLKSYDLVTRELEWEKEIFPPLPIHTDNCLYVDGDVYISFYTNYVYGYRPDGSQKFNTTIEYDKIPSRLAIFEDLLLVDLQSKTGGITYLATFYAATGSEKQRLATNYTIVDFFELENNLVLIAGNILGKGTLKSYDPFANVESSLMDIQGEIVCIEDMTDGNFIIGTDNSILLYDHDQITLTMILPGKAVYRIQYDDTENNLYTVSPKLIEKIKYPQMIFQKSYPIPDSILNIHLLYNK